MAMSYLSLSYEVMVVMLVFLGSRLFVAVFS